jgi:hypothetical protein
MPQNAFLSKRLIKIVRYSLITYLYTYLYAVCGQNSDRKLSERLFQLPPYTLAILWWVSITRPNLLSGKLFGQNGFSKNEHLLHVAQHVVPDGEDATSLFAVEAAK